MLQQLLIAAIAATMIVRPTEARVNSTGAIGTFMITSCDDCTKDKNSIFCTAGADGDFVANATYKITIKQKKALLGASDGSKYCWSGETSAAAASLCPSSTIRVTDYSAHQ